MAQYIYFDPEGSVLGKRPKGRGQTRKGATERPEGSGNYYVKVPAGISMEQFLDPSFDSSDPAPPKERWLIKTDIDGEEISREPIPQGKHKPKAAKEKPEDSGLFYLVVDPESGITQATGRKKAKRKIDFAEFRQSGLCVGHKDCGWEDGWEDGKNVFWAKSCVVIGTVGTGELQFNSFYPRIELDFDQNELRIFRYVGRAEYREGEEYDASRMVVRIIYDDAIEDCDIGTLRDAPQSSVLVKAKT